MMHRVVDSNEDLLFISDINKYKNNTEQSAKTIIKIKYFGWVKKN